jgi:hypothetical protein
VAAALKIPELLTGVTMLHAGVPNVVHPSDARAAHATFQG